VRVLDTHVHADHLSGGPELAASAGAPYSVDALADGETIFLGKSKIRVLAAPGHTPGSVMFLADDRFLLSGDTLFVSGVGRPDLGGHAAVWARDLFATLRDKIGPLADDTVVLPAHFASVDEIGPDGIVSVRLGDLRRSSPEMRIRDERSFVDAIVAAVSKPPAAYDHIVRANLGLESATEEQRTEWELGRNQCAASASAAAGRERA
jgi:glyoxylase-like metal-dependent hydrolase (beta-lactamase superfamily II)